MQIAQTVADRSHDEETQVGAVLIKNDSSAIIATGYNGFVRGAPDNILPSTRPHKYEYMLHAEQNLIFNCAKHGISTENTTLVCTHSPCKLCMRMLFNCGIKQVIVKSLYKDWRDILLMDDIAVDYLFSKDDGYYYLTYLVQKSHASRQRKKHGRSRKQNEVHSRSVKSSHRRKSTNAITDRRISSKNNVAVRKNK